jgi:hypothetical protein
LNAHIAVQFSEAMSGVSMEANPVVVSGPGGVAVAGTLGISGDHTTMVLTPSSGLSANTSYTVSVSGVADVSGNVAPAFSSSFSTGTGTLSVRPSVIGVSPGNGATGVASSAITVTFSAPVDGTTVNSGTLPVRINNSILVNGSYAVNGAVVTFAPSQPLPANTFIVVTVNTSGISDVAGNPTNFFQSSFTTGFIVTSVDPNNDALPAGQAPQFAALVIDISNTAENNKLDHETESHDPATGDSFRPSSRIRGVDNDDLRGMASATPGQETYI